MWPGWMPLSPDAGGHDATFAVAAALVHGFALGEADAMAVLQEYNQRCSPPWSERDLAYKLRSAANCGSPRGTGYLLGDKSGNRRDAVAVASYSLPSRRVEVKFDPAALSEAAGDFRPRLDWFAARSFADPALVDSGEFLSLLYPSEKVLIFSDAMSQGQALWPDDAIPPAGSSGLWFLSNPVDGISRGNPRTGKPSRRSEESVTRWKFALLESDEADPRLWLAALAKSSLPISAIYSSGGRSGTCTGEGSRGWLRQACSGGSDLEGGVGLLGTFDEGAAGASGCRSTCPDRCAADTAAGCLSLGEGSVAEAALCEPSASFRGASAGSGPAP
jgi:hypothetical protein